MNAIVFLLILLSFTTLLSRNQVAGLKQSSLYAPALILMGYAISPDGLRLVLPSTLSSMDPALRVGIFWTAFVAGLNYRTVGKSWPASTALETFKMIVTPILIASLLWLISPYNEIDFTFAAKVLILAGIFIPGSELTTLLLVGLGLAIWQTHELSPFALQYFGFTAAVALLLALSSWLIISSKAATTYAAKLVFLGIVILGAGLTANMNLNEALVGFLLGATLIPIFRMPKSLATDLNQTDTPVTMLLYFFLGLHMRLDIQALGIGVAVGMLRFSILALTSRHQRRDFTLSPIAVPIAIAIFLSISVHLKTSFYLSALTAGLITTEILALMLPVEPLEGGPARA